MQIIIHRVNKIKDLLKIPNKYGVEIDVRGYGDKLLLGHDPIKTGGIYDELDNYLKNFKHAFIIFNMKEAGYESRVIGLAEKYKIENYFLLDVEFPFVYKASRQENFRKIAVRYSEAEPIESAESFVDNGETIVDWVWIDTNTILPIDSNIVKKLCPFKTCLVCPERWGRPEDIIPYARKINELNFKLDAVMTSIDCAKKWEEEINKNKKK